jgi:hypothetical protein
MSSADTVKSASQQEWAKEVIYANRSGPNAPEKIKTESTASAVVFAYVECDERI